MVYHFEHQIPKGLYLAPLKGGLLNWLLASSEQHYSVTLFPTYHTVGVNTAKPSAEIQLSHLRKHLGYTARNSFRVFDAVILGQLYIIRDGTTPQYWWGCGLAWEPPATHFCPWCNFELKRPTSVAKDTQSA